MWLKTEDDYGTLANLENAYSIAIQVDTEINGQKTYMVVASYGIRNITLAEFKDKKTAKEYLLTLHEEIRQKEKEKYYVKN